MVTARSRTASPDKQRTAARQPRPAALGQVLIAWSPLGLILLGYVAAQIINHDLRDGLRPGAGNRLGFVLHVVEPTVADSWIFGRSPTIALQHAWYHPAGAQWYDAIVAIVYVSHFVVIPLIAAVLWFRDRARFTDWIGGVLLLTLIGIVTYVVYPMAPPWLAAQWGFLDHIDRISGIGWQYLQLGAVENLLGSSQTASNPVAAMPSLHAASAALVALFFWPGAAWWARAVLLLYPAVMGISLVYSGEHYVIDVIAGWIAAALAVAGWRLIRRSPLLRWSVPPGRDRASDSI